ncbi:MAG: preprotein translocase subunit SecE [Victivallaceae bacterium]|nr:preprotein translocase subunit SecE [Victivallaceae bacterium]
MSKREENGKNAILRAVDVSDRITGKVRHFFTETMAELGRCTWPKRGELVESTVLVVVMIAVLGLFVAIADKVAQVFIKLITTGTI